MQRTHLTMIGLLLATLLALHAAMLAGGGHEVEAHASSQHMHHAGMAMPTAEIPLRPASSELPQLQLPEMPECTLLGVAVIRADIVIDTAPAPSLIGSGSSPAKSLNMYAPFVTAISRAQLQVFLI